MIHCTECGMECALFRASGHASLVPRPHPLWGKRVWWVLWVFLVTHTISCCISAGHCYVMYRNTVHTHDACIGMGTSTDSAGLQSDWHAQIPPRVVNWTKLLAWSHQTLFPRREWGLGTTLVGMPDKYMELLPCNAAMQILGAIEPCV